MSIRRRFGAALAMALAALFLLSGVASAGPVWEGGTASCPGAQQVRLAIEYRGVLYIQWSEAGGMRHEAGPYYSPLASTLSYDTGASYATWRAEAKPSNDGVPGNIHNAFATCV